RIAAAVRNDAEGAAMVAAVLHLHEGARPALDGIDHVRGGFPHLHDVVDAHLLEQVDAEIGQRAVGMALQLLFVAEDEIDLLHGGEAGRVGLRRAAGDDDARGRVGAPRLADRLPCLSHRFAGNGAGVDDDRSAFERVKAGGMRLAPHHLRLVGIEPAAEGDDVDAVPYASAHAAPSMSRSHAPVSGSSRPENSHSAGPVMMTWSSARQSMTSLPPLGAVTVTVRPVRPVRAEETAAAQAAEPQASVSPAPRSQVRMVMASRAVTCAIVMLARSGKIG